MRKFGILPGFGRNAARAAEEEARKKAKSAKAEDDEQDETEAEDDEDDTEEEAAEDDDTEDGDGQDDDGESAEDGEGKQNARKARRQERARCAAIITSPEAEGRMALACHFAFKSSMSTKSALAALKAAPKSEAGGKGGLAAAMAQLGNPKIGMDGKKSPQSRGAIDHRSIYQKYNNAGRS